jgi:hypothetical protein
LAERVAAEIIFHEREPGQAALDPSSGRCSTAFSATSATMHGAKESTLTPSGAISSVQEQTDRADAICHANAELDGSPNERGQRHTLCNP